MFSLEKVRAIRFGPQNASDRGQAVRIDSSYEDLIATIDRIIHDLSSDHDGAQTQALARSNRP